jgi:hypothetical protein
MKRNRLIIIISLGIALLATIVPVFFILGDQGDAFGNGFTLEKVVPAIMVPVVLFIIIVSMRPLFRTFFPPRIKNGITAEAEVLEVRDTGTTINDDPQIALLLEVRPALGAVFQTELRTLVSRLEVSQYRPGCKAVVLYDPADPRRIVLQSIEPATSVAGSAEDRLTELDRLRERGLITAAEYERKRQDILDSL